MAGGLRDGPVRSGLDLGVEELGESGIVRHVLKIGVGTCLDTVARVTPDGLGEVLEAGLAVAGHGGEQGQTVEGIVGVLVILEDLLELLASVLVMAVVEQGDSVVVALFVAGKTVL